jgi:hypothetical protein
MKKALFVIIAFAGITIALTWYWTHGGRHLYGQFFKVIAPPIYDLIGFGDARIGAFRQRYINFVPFVGLVLVTPGVTHRRRALGLVGGLVALSIGHLVLNLTEGVTRGAHLPFVPSLISDALPLVFWVLVAFPAINGWFASALVPPEPRSVAGDEDDRGRESEEGPLTDPQEAEL